MNASVQHTAAAPQRVSRPPIAGDISSGVKKLTRKAEHGDGRSNLKPIPGAAKIFADGVAAGATWDEIEAALKKAAPWFKIRPLQPANSLYFTFAQSRCSIPGLAAMVTEKYGEDRGDGVLRVYSFPVVFFGDDVESVCRQRFESWKMGKLFRWSQDSKDGGRTCLAKEEVKPDPMARRRWGGRETVEQGPCKPNKCELFLNGDCEHSAELYFRIPGIPTGSMYFALKTKSIYSLLEFAGDPDDPRDMGVLDYVKRDFGHIAGLFQGKPLFSFSKTLDEVSRMDWKKGIQVKEQKEIIHLVTSGIDTVALLAQQEAAAAAEPAPADAARLTGPDSFDPALEPEQAEPEPEQELGGPHQRKPEPEPAAAQAGAVDPDPAIHNLRAERKRLSDELGYSQADLGELLSGNGYTAEDGHNPEKLAAQINMLQGFLDPKAAEQHVDASPANEDPF